MENTNRIEDKSKLPTTLSEEEEYIRSSIFVEEGGDSKKNIFGTRTTTIVTYNLTTTSFEDDNKGSCGRSSGSFQVTEKNSRKTV